MNNNHLKFVGLLVVLVLPLLSYGQEREVILGQAFDTKPHSYLYKWDPQQERLTFFRSVWTQNNTAIRLFSTDGRTRLTISPLAELTKYVAITIADVAATAEGGAAVAGVLKGTDNNLTDVILTYNDQAKLTQMWQVEPYNHRAIAVGSDGSVYAFGDRNDVKTFGQEENNA